MPGSCLARPPACPAARTCTLRLVWPACWHWQLPGHARLAGADAWRGRKMQLCSKPLFHAGPKQAAALHCPAGTSPATPRGEAMDVDQPSEQQQQQPPEEERGDLGPAGLGSAALPLLTPPSLDPAGGRRRACSPVPYADQQAAAAPAAPPHPVGGRAPGAAAAAASAPTPSPQAEARGAAPAAAAGCSGGRAAHSPSPQLGMFGWQEDPAGMSLFGGEGRMGGPLRAAGCAHARPPSVVDGGPAAAVNSPTPKKTKPAAHRVTPSPPPPVCRRPAAALGGPRAA